MSDVALMNAERCQLELQAKIERLSREMEVIEAALEEAKKEKARIDNFINTWYEFVGGGKPTTGRPSANSFNSASSKVLGPVSSGRVRNPSREEVSHKAVGYILTANRPLSRREIFECLANDGIEIHGKDPEMVLSTMLWRSRDQIVRLRGHGYWLKEKAYKPARYYPEHEDLLGPTGEKPSEGSKPFHGE